MAHGITIVGLGWDDRSLTALGFEALHSGRRLILRTERHPLADKLREEGIAFDTLDYIYETNEDWDTAVAAMEQTLREAAADTPVVFAVPGTLTSGEELIVRLSDITEAVYPAAQPEALIREGYVGGYTELPAIQFTADCIKRRLPLVLTSLDSRALAGAVKLELMHGYDDEQPVKLLEPVTGTVRSLELFELDFDDCFTPYTMLLIPGTPSPLTNEPWQSDRRRFDFSELKDVVAFLRSENGCDWDKVQTHESIRVCLTDEVAEVLEAMESGDDYNFCEELGDLLLQVVFHAGIAADEGRFDIWDVVSGVTEKMIRRHPALYGHEPLSWAEIKRREKERRL